MILTFSGRAYYLVYNSDLMVSRFIEGLERRRTSQLEYTPITADAYHCLSSWGMSRNQIRELQKLVKEFDGAYANCLKKVEAMNTLHTRGTRSELEILLPEVTDNLILEIGGSCGDIARLLAKKVLSNHLLSIIGETKGTPIELRVVVGNNRTHFKGGLHVWLGVVRKGDPENQNMIVLDGSYQEISCLKTNGYHYLQSDLLQDVKPESEIALPRSLIDMKEDGIYVETLEDKVLGLSKDRSVSFSVGFAVAWNFVHENIPFIRVGHMKGPNAAVFMINPNSNKLNWEFNYEAFSLTQSADEELHELLEAAAQIRFIPVQESL